MCIAFVCKYSLNIYKGSLFQGEHFSIIYIGFIGFKERAIFSAELDSNKDYPRSLLIWSTICHVYFECQRGMQLIACFKLHVLSDLHGFFSTYILFSLLADAVIKNNFPPKINLTVRSPTNSCQTTENNSVFTSAISRLFAELYQFVLDISWVQQ